MKQVRIIEDFTELSTYRDKWNEIAQQGATNTIFQTYEWHKCWWETFNDDKKLFVLLAVEDNVLVGVAPMVIIREKKWIGNKRIITFMGTGASDYCDFIIPKGRLDIFANMLEILFEQSHRWDQIRLTNIPTYSILNEIIQKVSQERQLKILSGHDSYCPTLVIRDNLNYVEKVLNKNKLKQQHNYFIKQGQYEVHHLRDEVYIEEYLENFINQHIERWKGTNSPSLFLDNRNKLFYKRLVKCLSENKWLLFTVLKSKGAPIAFHFGFDYNNIFLFYKPTFDQALAKHSPGMVLLKELIDYAMTSNKSEFDFSIGDEPYKRRFANVIRSTNRFLFFKYRVEYELNKSISNSKRLIKRAAERSSAYSLKQLLKPVLSKK